VSKDLKQTALGYLARGWAPIRVPYRSKSPGRKGWQNERHTREALANVFSNGAGNIGVLLGAPSGGLVDVDLDHPRAVALAPKFLPHTPARFGRASKPSSHWLYRLTAPAQTARFQAPGGGALVVCPASVY
jgi:hypothetical protein